MATVAAHACLEELGDLLGLCVDARQTRHVQVIRLLAAGHTLSETAELTGFGKRWVEQLLQRYNAQGLEALGDLRRNNGTAPKVLTSGVLARLSERLQRPPDDGGVWSGPKAAAVMARELSLEKVAPQRGFEALKALGYSLQKPRPRNPRGATPEQQEAFKKNLPKPLPKNAASTGTRRSRSSPATNTGSA